MVNRGESLHLIPRFKKIKRVRFKSYRPIAVLGGSRRRPTPVYSGPFRSIQNHDNKQQARIYPQKLKDIVSGRQSSIIAGLNKCKILTGTNASNGSPTRGYISLFCSLLWLACICVPSRSTTQDDWEPCPLLFSRGLARCHHALREQTVLGYRNCTNLPLPPN